MSLTNLAFVAVKKGSLLLPEKFLGNGHANTDYDTGMLHCFLFSNYLKGGSNQEYESLSCEEL